MLKPALLGVALWPLLGCTPDPIVSRLPIAVHQLSTCSLGSASALAVRALGDFPSQSISVNPARGSLSLDTFPLRTRELSFEASFGGESKAVGVLSLETAAPSRDVLLLPLAHACLLSDPLAAALPGAALAALPGGGLLIAGGEDGSGGARSAALVLPAGQDLLQQVPDGMLLRRAHASATLAGDVVVVAGGSADAAGTAQETYEIFDPTSFTFQIERSHKLLTGPRMQHGAALLPDGRVLLVGGRSEPSGEPLRSAELLNVASGERNAVTESAGLGVGRIEPSVLVLDSGEVLVVGGRDSNGDVVTSLERFDAKARAFTKLAVELPGHADLVICALPGGRLAALGCDTGAALGCELVLLLPTGSDFESVSIPLDFASQAPSGLEDLRMVTLRDGRLFVTARDPVAMIAQRAFVIDPSTATLVSREATRVADALLLLLDGSLIELDGFGAALRREDSSTVYESPSGNLLTEGRAKLALDAPQHWQLAADGWTSLVEGARIDLADLRFADVRVELEVDGAASLLLLSASNQSVAVSLGAAELRAPGCTRALPGKMALVVTRRGKSLLLHSSAGDALCSVTAPDGALRVAVQAAQGTLVRRFVVTRL